MSKLEALNLSYNRIIHFDLDLNPDEHTLGELKYLNCSHNHITAILTGTSTESRMMTKLSVKKVTELPTSDPLFLTRCRTVLLSDLSALPRLEEVNFASNGLRTLHLSLLQSKTVTKVNLSSNYIFKYELPQPAPPPSSSPVPSQLRKGQAVVAEKRLMG